MYTDCYYHRMGSLRSHGWRATATPTTAIDNTNNTTAINNTNNTTAVNNTMS